jgi:hypothetical protein
MISELLETKTLLRWTITGLSIVMLFVTAISGSITGSKASIYYAVWVIICYYGITGNFKKVKSILGFFIGLNFIAIAVVLSFSTTELVQTVIGENNLLYFVVGILIMQIPKILLYYSVAKSIEVDELSYMTTVTPRSGLQYVHPLITQNQGNGIESISGESIEVKVEIDEEKLWKQVYEEYEDKNSRRKGLWVKLYVEMNGETDKIKLAYLKERFNQMLQLEKLEVQRHNENLGNQQNSDELIPSIQWTSNTEGITNPIASRNHIYKIANLYLKQPNESLAIEIFKLAGLSVSLTARGPQRTYKQISITGNGKTRIYGPHEQDELLKDADVLAIGMLHPL